MPILQLLKKALCSDGESVNVLADDTDILCILLHHTTRLDPGKNIFMSSMKFDKSSGQHIAYRIQDIVEKEMTESTSSIFCLLMRSAGAIQCLVLISLGKLRF